MERHIGPFRTVSVLGQGGMGRVVLGVAPDGRYVAVKQVHADLAEDEGFRARFRREVDASRRVAGGYTAAVIDADPDAERPWLASQFVPGPSLAQALDAAGPLPEQAVRRLAAGLAHALADVHRAGLIHRDLKPSNVLLAEDGVRVIDFGIVRAVGDQTRITHDGSLIGSPSFMSPEQVLGQELTPASDVFSLGATLVMACTGKAPFVGSSVPRILHEVVHAEPDLSEVPPGLRGIIAPCLAKDPADRPTPQELLALIGPVEPSARPWPEAVNTLIHDQLVVMGALVRQATRPETAPEAVPVWRRRRTRPLIAAVAGLAAVAAIGLTVGRPYVVEAYRQVVLEPVPTPGTTPLAQRKDVYPASPPHCEQTVSKLSVPSGFEPAGGGSPQQASGAEEVDCYWATRTGDQIRVEWRFFTSLKGKGTGAEQAKKYHEASYARGKTRRELALGFAEEGLWQPPDFEADPSCKLRVRDVNMTVVVSVNGPHYPPGECEAFTREFAGRAVDVVRGS
ncbi:serine/threonine protein kinase [Streptomyces sp. NBC_00868]|uniref:serine/threonine-protein kinase n=1 Tax=unclassified Streptomyces TaxID=2593676 RepID=UPI00324ADD96|nr:serine/threonine protein kinase [Streptomyces sp. NBC_00868]